MVVYMNECMNKLMNLMLKLNIYIAYILGVWFIKQKKETTSPWRWQSTSAGKLLKTVPDLNLKQEWGDDYNDYHVFHVEGLWARRKDSTQRTRCFEAYRSRQ